MYSGWWFGCHLLFSHILGCIHHPNWRSYFSEGFFPNHQPVFLVTTPCKYPHCCWVQAPAWANDRPRVERKSELWSLGEGDRETGQRSMNIQQTPGWSWDHRDIIYIYNVGYWLVWGATPPNNLGILFKVQISWVPGVKNKKSLDKEGFQLKSIYGQLIFLLNLEKIFW